MSVRLPNDHLAALAGDITFHLGIPLDKTTKAVFGDVKFVCIGGTSSRVWDLACCIAESYYNKVDFDKSQLDHKFENDRFSGYKIGSVWCVSHGMGMPSASIALHEIFKVLQFTECSDVNLIRFGTCGGIGVEGGTLVVSDGVFTSGMKDVYQTSCLGQPLQLPIEPDLDLIRDAMASGSSECPVIQGKTYCAQDFYIDQGRLDGAICDYDEAGKQRFLKELSDLGVRNIEMESAAVLAFAKAAGVRAIVVCLALLNRVEEDTPVISEDTMTHWNRCLLAFVCRFIHRRSESGEKHDV